MNAVGVEDWWALAGAQSGNEAPAGRGVEGHRADTVHSNDSGGRMMALKMLNAAHQGASGPGTDEHIIHMAEMLADRTRRGSRMGTRVGCIFVLIEPDIARVAGHFLADQLDARPKEPAVGVRDFDLDDLGAVAAHHADVMAGAVGVDHAGKRDAPLSADHRQRHPEIARRGLDQNRVRAQQPPRLKVIDQPHSSLELDRACRVERFHFQEKIGPQASHLEEGLIVNDFAKRVVHGLHFHCASKGSAAGATAC